MNFVFSRRFFILLALGFVPLSLSWNFPALRYAVLICDVALLAFALFDFFTSRRLPAELNVRREFEKRFAIGDEAEIKLIIENFSARDFRLKIKDEFPPELKLNGKRAAEFAVEAQTTAAFVYGLTPLNRGKYQFGAIAVRYLSKFGLVWCQTELGAPETVKVYPNIRRAREMALRALGAVSFLAVQRKAVLRGEGRDFESLRDYVRGDELRHISWTATARRSKLTTRQYQIERDQTILIAIDAGRLMTGRIGAETKFDTAIHAALALMSAAARGGDNCGLMVFGRKVRKYLPPQKGVRYIDAVLEALHDLEPEMVEPSYSRAFQFIAAHSKKRSFVVILTDLVDKESSKELIASLKLIRPRHLPLVVTIGDRDLNQTVSIQPKEIRDVFTQSAAEEIIYQRESALRLVETLGGLALDVTTESLAPKLLENYLKVKERGLL